jgi:hypothetical protein
MTSRLQQYLGINPKRSFDTSARKPIVAKAEAKVEEPAAEEKKPAAKKKAKGKDG